MNTLIIGGSSKIGKYFKSKNYLKTFYKNNFKNGIYFNLFKNDLSNILTKHNVKKILLLSAISDPDECCKKKKLSNKINVIYTKKLIDQIIKKNIYFIFYSSEYIFDGLKGNYSEKSIAKPNNLYGKQKLKLEIYIKKKTKKFAIFRIAKTYTDDLKDNTLISNHLRSIKKGVKKLSLAYDQKFNPLYVKDLINITEFFLKSEIKGTFNIGGPEKLSRFDSVKKINNSLIKKNRVKIKKIKFSNFKLIENRPLNVTMNCAKLTSLYKKKLKTIKEVARKVISEKFNKNIIKRR